MSIIQAIQAAVGVGGEPPAPPAIGNYYFQGMGSSWLSQSNPTPALQSTRFPDGSTGDTLYFDGTTWTVTQNLGQCNEIEIDLWIYPTGFNRIIVTEQGQSDQNTGYHYAMIEIDSDSRIRARSWPQSGVNALISDPISINAWHHIYFRHSNGTARLEVDSVLVGTDNYGREAPGTSYIGIGTYSVTGITNNNRYQGKINFLQIRNFNFIGSSWIGSNLTYRPSLQFELDANNESSYNISTPNQWNDTSGNGNNCTLYGSPTYVPDGSATGTPAAYFTFDRNSLQFGQITNTGDLNQFTAEAVFRLSEPYTNIRSTAVVTTTFDLDGGAIDYGYVNYCIGTNGNAEYSAYWHGQFFEGSIWRQSGIGFVGYSNTWFHCIVTYDGATLKFYKNGVEINSSLVNDTAQAGGGPIRIGRRWDGADNSIDNYFPGDIGVVRVWYGAMSPGDVIKQYNQAVNQGYPNI